MADVFFGEDFEGDGEEEEAGVSPLDEEEELIDPLLFVRSFVDSEDVMKRHRVAQTVSDAVRWLEKDADIEIIFQIVRQLLADEELRVRVELIEELPDIVATCLEEGHNRALVLGSLSPALARSLYDSGDLVRKAAHNSLAALLEHALIDGTEVEKSIVPVLKRMIASESCVSQLEAARVVMRTTPRVNQEVIVRSFVPLIKTLSGAQFFEVRKLCASEMGPVCLSVDRDVSEKYLLPLFVKLCEDAVWGVRKGCAEASYEVSLSASMDVRFSKLAPLFINFLGDASKWVQKAAFQSLGAFISTFYTPPENVIHSISCSSFEPENLEKPDGSKSPSLQQDNSDDTGTNADSFSPFLFWKIPLPNIDDDLKEAESSSPSPAVCSDSHVVDESEPDGTLFSTAKSSSLLDFDSSEEVTSITWNFSQLSLSDDESPDLPPQNVVPSKLLDFYVSMVDPVRVQTIDLELPMHCAFSFPAVALTLGAPHWGQIRELYLTLLSSLQWKIRRTLAFSIHELAKIVSRDAILNDLLPAFDSFTKDVDEVRIGVLSHLSDFLLTLPASHRKLYLKQLYLFQQTDNRNNWRFRLVLAEQLASLCLFCGADDISNYICPITLSLALDRICDVRIAAIHAIGSVLGRLKQAPDADDVLAKVFIDRLISQLADSSKWVTRQTFVTLCHHLLTEKVVPLERFSQKLLPRLLLLAEDKVVNVRLAVSRSINDLLIAFDRGDENSSSVCTVLQRLLKDKDQDVKEFAQAAKDAVGYVSLESEGSEELQEEFVDAISDLHVPVTVEKDNTSARQEPAVEPIDITGEF